MAQKLWKIKWVFVLVGLFVAFATCVKEKDPNKDKNEIKAALTEIVQAISKSDLQGLNQHYVQPVPEGQGPNALLAAISTKADSTFHLHKLRFSPDNKRTTVRFAFSKDPKDTAFSFLKLVNDNGWKIEGFLIN